MITAPVRASNHQCKTSNDRIYHIMVVIMSGNDNLSTSQLDNLSTRQPVKDKNDVSSIGVVDKPRHSRDHQFTSTLTTAPSHY